MALGMRLLSQVLYFRSGLVAPVAGLPIALPLRPTSGPRPERTIDLAVAGLCKTFCFKLCECLLVRVFNKSPSDYYASANSIYLIV